jgi:hypothetical protein
MVNRSQEGLESILRKEGESPTRSIDRQKRIVALQALNFLRHAADNNIKYNFGIGYATIR